MIQKSIHRHSIFLRNRVTSPTSPTLTVRRLPIQIGTLNEKSYILCPHAPRSHFRGSDGTVPSPYTPCAPLTSVRHTSRRAAQHIHCHCVTHAPERRAGVRHCELIGTTRQLCGDSCLRRVAQKVPQRRTLAGPSPVPSQGGACTRRLAAMERHAARIFGARRLGFSGVRRPG